MMIQVFGRESLRSALNGKTATEGSNTKIGTQGSNTLFLYLYLIMKLYYYNF